jgi:thiol:disulfide interchange protein
MGSQVRTSLAVAVAVLAVSFTGCKSQSDAPDPSATTETAAPAPTTQFLKKHLYSETADPKADIAAALKQAQSENKRVILDFGGDWCGDCQVLDIYMHQPPNADLLANNFVVVHVDIGRMDHNVDIAEKYDVPIKKGVPALAVLDAHGKLLYSQVSGDFENMRNMRPEDVTDFLNRWKG